MVRRKILPVQLRPAPRCPRIGGIPVPNSSRGTPTDMKKLTYCIGLFALGALATALLPGPREVRSNPDERQAKKSEKQQAGGISARIPWTTSKITGTPEPPHPYRIVRAYP